MVLRRTKMPAVLVEAGFLDNEKDNAFFDANLAATADAIADGILETFEELEAREDQAASGRSLDFIWCRPGCSGCAPMPRPSFRS